MGSHFDTSDEKPIKRKGRVSKMNQVKENVSRSNPLQ